MPADGRQQAVALAARAAVVATTGRQVRAAARGDRETGVGCGACFERDREPEQPVAELLLPAQAVGQRLPETVAVLPQPPALPAQRKRGEAGQEPARSTERRETRTLAGTAGLPAIQASVVRGNGRGV